MKPVVMLSGVTCTGKTAVCAAVQEKHGRAVAVAPSFTRVALRAEGVNDAADMLALDNVSFADLQSRVFDRCLVNFNDFRRAAEANRQVSAVLFERSPIDYAAYVFQFCTPGTYSRPAMLRQVKSVLRSMKGTLFMLPYPPPFDAPPDSMQAGRTSAELALWNIELHGVLRELGMTDTAIYCTSDSVQERAAAVSKLLSL